LQNRWPTTDPDHGGARGGLYRASRQRQAILMGIRDAKRSFAQPHTRTELRHLDPFTLADLDENCIHPITILSTLPSAGVGAVLALPVFKTKFSIITMIGLILLIAIVNKMRS
jgi:hypothetical protein